MEKSTWVVAVHAGVLINEEADCLAVCTHDYIPMELYNAYIKLFGKHNSQECIYGLL